MTSLTDYNYYIEIRNIRITIFHIIDEFETTKGPMTLPEHTVTTAEIISFFDDLFDSFNRKKGQGLTCVITDESEHISFWQRAIRKLQETAFVEKGSHTALKHNGPKCIQNYIWTIRGTINLWRNN